MIRLKLYNSCDKYQYTIPLDFKNYDEYNNFCKKIEFYEFIMELKDKYGRLYINYDEEIGVDNDNIEYTKYIFNERTDFKKSVIMWKRYFYKNKKLKMKKKTFKDININEVKLSLKFKFISDDTVNIKLFFVQQKCLKKEHFGIYRDFENDFSVWSCGTFLFDERQLRIPDEKNIDGSIQSTCKFRDEKHKRDTLKKLYSALHHWSNKNSDFTDKGEVILDDEYWYVL